MWFVVFVGPNKVYVICCYTPAMKLRDGVYWIHPVRPSVCRSVRCHCPDDNSNSFLWISFFWYMHHMRHDLGWDWIWVPYLIKYAHNDQSCDWNIFVIPGVNFSVRAFKLGLLRDLGGTHDIRPFFFLLHFNICVFLNFLLFLNEIGCSLMTTWIVFIGFQWYLVYMSFWSRSWTGLNISIIPH